MQFIWENLAKLSIHPPSPEGSHPTWGKRWIRHYRHLIATLEERSVGVSGGMSFYVFFSYILSITNDNLDRGCWLPWQILFFSFLCSFQQKCCPIAGCPTYIWEILDPPLHALSTFSLQSRYYVNNPNLTFLYKISIEVSYSDWKFTTLCCFRKPQLAALKVWY